MQKGGNSGLGIARHATAGPPATAWSCKSKTTPLTKPLDKHSQLAIYGNVPPVARAERPGEWNSVVVKADGWMISAWVNGELVQQFNTLHHPELKHRSLRGWIGTQEHQAWIRIRNFRVLEAPDGTGLSVWSNPPKPTAAVAMIDRLLNSETLSRRDGIASGVVTKKVAGEKPGEHVLADLTGPGAVTRVAHSGNEGRLAFYFDGEKKPRIECKPEDLWKHVPPLNEDRDPVVTYLAYRKSLKIVLREAKAADYRIDHVAFPESLLVATFTDRLSSIPRGWLSPSVYRQYMSRCGIHREFDPALRIRPEAKTLAPGKREVLAKCDGAGLVRWIKLCGPANEFLRGNDVWLEATIDGESEPAISAPARFWLPGFVQGSSSATTCFSRAADWRISWLCPLATESPSPPKIGAASRSRRLASNCRSNRRPNRPARTSSAGRDFAGFSKGEATARPRRSASKAPDVGWGLVVATEGGTMGIDTLAIDGKPADGWKAPNLDAFLGRSGNDFRQCLSGNCHGVAWRYLFARAGRFREIVGAQVDPKGGCPTVGAVLCEDAVESRAT